jgi:hypothetical protein
MFHASTLQAAGRSLPVHSANIKYILHDVAFFHYLPNQQLGEYFEGTRKLPTKEL